MVYEHEASPTVICFCCVFYDLYSQLMIFVSFPFHIICHFSITAMNGYFVVIRSMFSTGRAISLIILLDENSTRLFDAAGNPR